MTRRITAILLLEPALDANYESCRRPRGPLGPRPHLRPACRP